MVVVATAAAPAGRRSGGGGAAPATGPAAAPATATSALGLAPLQAQGEQKHGQRHPPKPAHPKLTELQLRSRCIGNLEDSPNIIK